MNFYPRSPCGERHLRVLDGSKSSIISIHALLAESDKTPRNWRKPHEQFLSTLSLRRATCGKKSNGAAVFTISIHALLAESDHDTYVIMEATKVISIHALLAESDFACVGWLQVIHNFYPRSPCGERPSEYVKLSP